MWRLRIAHPAGADGWMLWGKYLPEVALISGTGARGENRSLWVQKTDGRTGRPILGSAGRYQSAACWFFPCLRRRLTAPFFSPTDLRVPCQTYESTSRPDDPNSAQPFHGPSPTVSRHIDSRQLGFKPAEDQSNHVARARRRNKHAETKGAMPGSGSFPFLVVGI
jgi:hypothetical protein